MKLTITVKPNSRKTQVEPVGEGEYRVWVTASPQDGKANEAVIEALADHFDVPKSRIRIVHGASSRKKLIEILPG